MKLKIQEFEELARRKGYRGGKALMKKLGAGKYVYDSLKRGCEIGHELVRAIYNEFGALTMMSVLDLEGETLQSFKSKYIKVGGTLY